MKSQKRYSLFILPIALLVLFFALIYIIKHVNVQAVGPEGTSVGLASLNLNVFEFLGGRFNPLCYKLSDVLGNCTLLIAAIMAFLALRQFFSRKSLFKMDVPLLFLMFFYTIVVCCYILFIFVVVNYRPVIMDGEGLESSFPSSHTMLSICVLGSGMIMAKRYIKASRSLRITAYILMTLLMMALIIFRITANIHWVSDILGGILLSGCLLSLYYASIRIFEK